MKSAEVDQSLQAHLAPVNNGFSVEKTNLYVTLHSKMLFKQKSYQKACQ